jgi:hypothetical protein
MPTPAESSILPATFAPAPTIYPPVFDPHSLGDNRLLASFILTRTDKTTGAGEGQVHQDTIGYIKEPFSAYELEQLGLGAGSAPFKQYLVGGRFYETNASVDWLISLSAAPDDVGALQNAADMRKGYIKGSDASPKSAKFVGQEDFRGLPANHFTFDQTDLSGGSDPTGTYKIQKAEGDLYLSQAGNYPLRFHAKLTGNVYSPGGSAEYFPGVHEITEELSSINQLKDIAVPPEYLKAEQTLVDLGLPLPAGTTLAALRRFAGSGVEGYF